jgi:hypothetical protein
MTQAKMKQLALVDTSMVDPIAQREDPGMSFAVE